MGIGMTRSLKSALLGAAAVITCGAANAAVLDITTQGTNIASGGAIFSSNLAPGSLGSGSIDPFMRIQQQGNDVTQSGYNTSNVVFYPNVNDPFTDDLVLSQIPTVTIGGVVYREFLFDGNQSQGSNSEISMTQFKIYLETTGGLGGEIGTGAGPQNLIYDLGVGNSVLLDTALNSGSGSGWDMIVYVADSLFGADDTKFVYLFNEMGTAGTPVDNGFDEWALGIRGICVSQDPCNPGGGGGGGGPIPEPATLAVLGAGLLGLGLMRRRRAV